MSDELEMIEEIFRSVARNAINAGYQVRLERSKNKSQTNVLNGALGKSESDYDSLVLNVFPPEQDEDEESEADAECQANDTTG